MYVILLIFGILHVIPARAELPGYLHPLAPSQGLMESLIYPMRQLLAILAQTPL
ncbi:MULTISPECIES: hypothetical protein [unclassified Paludibacterium]|uniref:hypothetical protein n=1 Tax=unclassified Paludibacterium TaxID=2618429 RepID=UPI001C047182|nr:hypothetical protein [Paludibacterium sp. B53371]BEV70783.1 hypothetical protein THUN1379_02650 [Paludibacterium sp. THUN1379]